MNGKNRIIKILIGVVLLGLVIASAASAAEQKPIVFAVVYPNSGMAAMYGKTSIDSIGLAIEEINAAGGVLGRKIVMEFRDGQGDPEINLREVKAMVYEKDALVVQVGVGSSQCMPSVDFAGEYGKKENFLLIPHTIGEQATEAKFNPYIFRPYQISYATTYTMAHAIFEKYHPKKILCIAADYSYPREAVKAFKDQYRKLDPKTEFTRDIFTPLGTSDYTPFISKVMASGADVVLNLLWGGDYASFLKQAFAYGYFDKMTEAGTTSGLWPSVSHLRKGDPWPKGVLSGEYAPIWEAYSKLGEGLNDRYYKKFGYYMGENAVHNYSYTHIMANAIKEAGSTDDVHKIIRNLEGKEVEHALGRFKVRGYDHQIIMPFWAGTVKWPDTLPHPRTMDCWAPPREEWDSIYHSIAEIKAIREKAGNPYANYLGH